jgi:hypothetical protein
MKDKLKEVVDFAISLAFNIHKLTLIYVSVFKKLIEEKAGGFNE